MTLHFHENTQEFGGIMPGSRLCLFHPLPLFFATLLIFPPRFFLVFLLILFLSFSLSFFLAFLFKFLSLLFRIEARINFHVFDPDNRGAAVASAKIWKPVDRVRCEMQANGAFFLSTGSIV